MKSIGALAEGREHSVLLSAPLRIISGPVLAVVGLLTLSMLSADSARGEGTVASCAEDDFLAALDGGGLVTFTQDCNITLTAPISIDVDTTIDAQGHAVTLSGNQQMLVFNVAAGVNFTSLGLTITSGMNTNGGALYVNANATVLLTNCTLAGNSAIGPNGVAGASGANSASGDGGSGQSGTAGSPGFGGAIFNLGNLALLNCTLVTNTATGGIGGGGGNGGNGGGQLAHGGNGGNGGAGAAALGGAVYHTGGALLVSNCTFSGNSAIGGNGGAGGTNGTGFTPGLAGSGGPGASGSGAGLYSNQTNTVLNCTFSDNAAQGGNSAAGGTASNGTGTTGAPGADSSGGGIYLAGRGMVVNCTFFNDKATGGGGGNGGNGAGQLSQGGNGGNGGNGAGGGLYNTGFCGVTNCTFSKGSAVGGTNGLAGSGTFPGSAGHAGQARGGNTANGGGTFWLKNSILATNLSGGNGYGPISAAGNNLSTDASIALGTNSFANTDPKLGSLTNNGGPTRTMALLTTNTPGVAANSPALNAGDDTGCPATDQRGVSRPQPVGGHCDIGAYEATILPAIITPPQNQSQTNGGTVTFFVSAAGAPILKYRWRFNGTNISGAVSSNYTIAQITITNAGNYDVTVTNSFGSVTSSVATLSVGPNITIQPTNQEVAAGGDTTFMVTASGTSPLSYQWYFNETNAIVGATSSAYTLINAQAGDDGDYTVAVANSSGSVTSALAFLTVDVLPSIQTQPASTNVAPGSSVTFTVTATGSSPLTYQWYFNETNLITGATGPSWTFTATTTDSGGYRVLVANDFGSAKSAAAILTVGIPVFTISGRVLDGSNGLAGATVAGPGTNSAVTDANGNYVMAGVQAGDYYVFASLAGYTFSPSQPVTVGPDATNINFTVTGRNFSISGRVTTNGVGGLSNVTIIVAGYTQPTTDASGAYITTLPAGTNTYTLTPQAKVGKQVYGFVPSSRTVSVLTNDVANVDFLAGALLFITHSNNGTVLLTLHGPGTQRIEASTNLINWLSIFTNQAPFQFPDNGATNFHLRFYRAVQQ